jgi:hypothetical protein
MPETSTRALIALGAVLCVLAAAGLALMLMSTPAWAHTSRGGHVYEGYCCNGSDCAEIPDEAVTAGPNGWVVTLRRGQHPMVVSPQVQHVIPYKAGRPSTDGKFHVCLFPNEATMRCFYNPPSGF